MLKAELMQKHRQSRFDKSAPLTAFVLSAAKTSNLCARTGKLCPLTDVYKLLFACKCAVGQISINQHKHVTNYAFFFPNRFALNKLNVLLSPVSEEGGS